MTENEFLLQDRIAKIKSMNDLHNLEDNAYIAFSGGKDSVALSEIVDIALPGNKFPRVYINTGIEYQLMVEYVKQRQISDERIIVIQPKVPIIPMLKEEGYPFKSKEFSQKLNLFQRKGLTKTVTDYLGLGEKKTFLCPSKLKVLFSDEYSLKISDHCCLKLKKEPSDIWARENRRQRQHTLNLSLNLIRHYAYQSF